MADGTAESLYPALMLTDLPNVLTLSRIAAIPLMVLLAALQRPDTDAAAMIVFSLAGITDYFDGKLARDRSPRYNTDVRTLGGSLDALLDHFHDRGELP